MTAFTVTPIELLAGLLILFGAVRLAGMRRLRARAVLAGARLVSLAGRTVFNAAVIVAVQWLVTMTGSGWLRLAVLGVPALFASYTLTRALTVTTSELPRWRGGGRR